MLIINCPRCRTQHVSTTQLWQDSDAGLLWRILRCQNPNCRRLVLALTRPSDAQIETMYPVGSYELASTATISDEIRADYHEAGLCLDAGCPRASMVMSRRVLQRALKEQGCTKHKLADSIQQAVDSSILRKPFHAIAEEIRQYGNLSAHPDDDQLGNAKTHPLRRADKLL